MFICNDCGYGSASWMGKCPDCGQWNTLKEKPEFAKASSGKKESIKKITITPLKKISSKIKSRKKTNIYEFDRVLGDGFIPGEVILLTGEPGIGKSTLLLQSLQHLKTLYISGEESAEQIKDRADRLSISLDHFLFSNDLQVEGIIEGTDEIKDSLDVIVIDSIQTIYSKDIEGVVGSVSQLKDTAKKLITFAKQNNITIIMIGHVTKEGIIAGPKTLEHFVDCVLNFEGEKVSHYRLLRASKNRFGPTDEIGIFEMKSKGLVEVDNPLVFLEKNPPAGGEPGKAIVGVAEGKRPLFFEIQTLVVPTVLPSPRRVVNGIDYNKVLLLLAVVRKHLNVPLDNFDIYVNVIGGVSVRSTAADLGLITSLLSSLKNIPLPKGTVFIGEVGLMGEIREVYFEEKIISEAKRLGFKKIYSSQNTSNVKEFRKVV
ncbi:DNA repair protein RadA [Candidatus Roizmanbacteria bacterium]|nr:DNA repair protein RadA [Candidatus Roizmanbacteria bacterium]